jgi:hypothetical protein
MLPTSLMNISSVGNFLTTLPTLPTSLKYLNVSNNLSISSLPALPNSLSYLDCGANALSSLPALPTSLKYLYCDTNSLTSLPTLPDSLIVLSCGNNYIHCFPTFPSSLLSVNLNNTIHPWIDSSSYTYNCLPNYVLPAMNSYTTTPLCAAGNTHGCPITAVGISQISGLNTNISIYPNPAKNVLTVEGLMVDEKSTLVLTDMLGNTVKQMPFNTPHITLNITDLSEGIYNLSISGKEGVVNKRVVIVR